jgi:hypothetical protein
LIYKRFEEFKSVEGWKDEDFYPKRMNEKVSFLSDHLPPFLVKNSRIYSILSIGIHELEEKQSLAFFPVLKQSLVVILEEDKKKKEELDRQAELEKAISSFEHSKAEQPVSLSSPDTKSTLENLG